MREELAGITLETEVAALMAVAGPALVGVFEIIRSERK
jgi:hypothetical protein